MKLIAALTVSVAVLAAQTERPARSTVTAVRHWSLTGVTRVVVEVSGEFTFATERLHNPERVYFDIPNSHPRFTSGIVVGRRVYTEDVDDPLLKRIRVAETLPGVTRVVLDLAGPEDATTSQLANPERLVIELRRALPGAPIPTELPAAVSSPPRIPTPPPAIPSQPPAVSAPVTPLPSMPAVVTKPELSKPEAPKPEITPMAKPASKPPARIDAAVESKPAPVEAVLATPLEVARTEVAKPEIAKPDVVKPAPAAAEPVPSASEISKAARHTSTGETSLVRALGLKVGRVVIDPGHGGHDQGTQGPKGLQEKELVLDVAMRVGKLIEDHMGSEVIYTRTDDTFIPLEGRTALANEKKADLFLSIHANSSPIVRINGVETYYLNFADSKDAMDVASRENASSQKSIFELRDIIQKITLHDKAEESREFAGRIQTSLYGLSAKNFPQSRNRGVKKAPFVVLIGANMPSVLAEIGFLSNPREEALLKRPDYRQKLAEALYRGLSRYADSLSHFQAVAQAKD